MKTSNLRVDPKTKYAAQSAREGLINVMDLSLLTGVPAAQLTAFAKKGLLTSYGEYHGKRFYNFEEIVTWLNDPDQVSEAKPVILATMEELQQDENCPYALEKEEPSTEGAAAAVRLVWKEILE